jgi:hypothetical protein
VTTGIEAASSSAPNDPRPDRSGEVAKGRTSSKRRPRHPLLGLNLSALALAFALVAASLLIAAIILVKSAITVVLVRARSLPSALGGQHDARLKPPK